MKLGWIRDAKKRAGETPDLVADDMLKAVRLPAQHTNRHLVPSVLNQGDLGSCVTCAGFQAVRASHIKQGVKAPKIGSRLFSYYLCRAYQHTTAVDSGTQTRIFYQTLNKFGFCPEDVYPYDDRTISRNNDAPPFSRMPSTKAFMAAFDQRSPTVYRRIHATGQERIDAVKRALAAGYLVAFGTDVTQAFFDDYGRSPIHAPHGEPIAGGHALCLVGYSGSTFEVLNSWGKAWGDQGFCLFAADYLTWSETVDFWIVEHAPRYS